MTAVAEASMNDGLSLWIRVREAADDELESGRRAANVAGYNASPYGLAQFLALRHIAYYIGQLSAAHPDAYFHIISKDKGFDPLIKHLKDRKIFCSRSASVLEIPLVKSTDKLPSRQRAADFYEKRIASAKARPATVMSLQSAINSHFHKMLSGKEVAYGSIAYGSIFQIRMCAGVKM